MYLLRTKEFSSEFSGELSKYLRERKREEEREREREMTKFKLTNFYFSPKIKESL